MRRLLVATLMLTAVVGVCQEQTNGKTGRIEGTVLDRSGNSVRDAIVEAVPQFPIFDELRPQSVTTNASGHFSFSKSFRMGTYKIYAYKAADAYPDHLSKFYDDDAVTIPVVHLTDDHPYATVFVDLTEKAAVLTGSVVDAETRAAIKAMLVFFDDAGDTMRLSTDGKYRALLPGNKTLTMMVMAFGYGTYKREFLTFKPGETARLEIELSKER